MSPPVLFTAWWQYCDSRGLGLGLLSASGRETVFYDPTNLVVALLSGVMSGPDFLPPTPRVSDISEGQSGAVSEGWQYETLSFLQCGTIMISCTCQAHVMTF